MRNTLEDLNNHLFMQLERLGDEETKGEKLEEEMKRAKSISGIAKEIISNASLVLDAQTVMQESFEGRKNMPRILLGERK